MNLREARDHQKKALEYANGKKNIALFMEMRLGKTMVAIRWANSCYGSHLVIAPLSVLPGWEEELLKEGIPASRIQYLKTTTFQRLTKWTAPLGTWCLINYEAVRSRPEVLYQRWNSIICDESTKIRNPKAQITKLLCEKAPNTRRAILSGLPNPEGPLDYFEQMRFLKGEFMGYRNYWQFRERLFWAPQYAPYDYSPRLGTTTKIRSEIEKHAFVLTRKDANLGPEKIYEKRYVEMNPAQKKMYKMVEKEFAYNDSLEDATKWAIVKFIWLARIAGGFSPEKEFLSDKKAKELLNLLEGELKGQKVVVWFRFNSELVYTSEVLERAKIKYFIINGDVKPEDRKIATTRFQSTRDSCVMLAQVKCGKFGLNWSVASTAIYYSNAYDGEDRAQSEDRILDVGKKDPLLYIDLITKNTIDENVVDMLRQKWNNSRIFMTKLVESWLKGKVK